MNIHLLPLRRCGESKVHATRAFLIWQSAYVAQDKQPGIQPFGIEELNLKGHLRALPTEIVSPTKWCCNRKWRPTNGPADRPATKFPKISSFDEFCTGCSHLGKRWAFSRANNTKNIVLVFFVCSEVDGWLAAKIDHYLTYGTSRNAVFPASDRLWPAGWTVGCSFFLVAPAASSGGRTHRKRGLNGEGLQ